MRDIGRRLFNIQPICKWDAPILKLWNTFTALRRRSVRPDLMSFGPFNQLRMSHGSIQYFQFNPLHPTADSIWPFKWSNSPIFGYTQEPGESKKQKKKKKLDNKLWMNEFRNRNCHGVSAHPHSAISVGESIFYKHMNNHFFFFLIFFFFYPLLPHVVITIIIITIITANGRNRMRNRKMFQVRCVPERWITS